MGLAISDSPLIIILYYYNNMRWVYHIYIYKMARDKHAGRFAGPLKMYTNFLTANSISHQTFKYTCIIHCILYIV